jgi:pimeloyl-ACP methyl ester carboxylesterase
MAIAVSVMFFTALAAFALLRPGDGAPATLVSSVPSTVKLASGAPSRVSPVIRHASTAPDPGAMARAATRDTEIVVDNAFIRVPPNPAEPAIALVVLHGMGGSGQETARPLLSYADAQGWITVAPTFDYGDWRDPGQLTREAVLQTPMIARLLDRLPEITGLQVESRALVYGFSRGGQAANRFALAYPERAAGVAVVSCGTYTLPFPHGESGQALAGLPFPYGTQDFADLFGHAFDDASFARVPFWVGVGSRDDDPVDVPRQWDALIGDDRLERAQRFTSSLRMVGVDAQLQVFPDLGHRESAAVHDAALTFLTGAASRIAPSFASPPARRQPVYGKVIPVQG